MAVPQDNNQTSIDIDFQVPFTHRLRFTLDVFGKEVEQLSNVLEPSGAGPARVQFWIDADVAAARPDLSQKIRQIAEAHPKRISLASNIQMVPGFEHVVTVTPNQSGTYSVVCNEYCGIGHHQMVGRLYVK